MQYRYTECGLDNVFIEGVEPAVDDHGDKVFRIENINGLHKVIARGILGHRHSISGRELRFLRTEMGLTQAELATLVHCDAQTIARWEKGQTPIDPPAEAIIRMRATEVLGLAAYKSVEDVASRCVPSATIELIRIDGSDPKRYRLAA